MEHKNYNADNDSITLYDLWKLFISKWKIMIVVALIAAILGAGLAFLMNKQNEIYTSVVSFNLTPSDSTDSLLYNLQSEMFAEKLLLDENGLPPKESCDAKDYDAALKAINAYEEARAKKAEAKRALDYWNDENDMVSVERRYNHLVSKYNEIYDILQVYKNAYDTVAGEETHKEMMAKYEAQLEEAAIARDTYYEETYFKLLTEKQDIQREYNIATLDVKERLEESREASEKVIAPWRNNSEVRARIATINKSVTYEYAKLLVSASANDGTAQDVKNKGYIKINIAVEDDKEFAEWLVDRYKSRIPDFVEKHMEDITGTTTAICTLISPFSDINDQSNNVMSSIIKYAIAFGAVGAVATYLVCLLSFAVKRTEESKKAIEAATKSETEKKENE